MKNQNSLKVFILEDDHWYGSMLQHYLSLNPDYEVKRFTSSKEFFSQLHEKPDVVTLDYSMPDMDGGEVLKKNKRRSSRYTGFDHFRAGRCIYGYHPSEERRIRIHS